MAYIYTADVYCDACGQEIRERITLEGKAPEAPDDEHTYDSDDFPKYYDSESEESDSPDNCASGEECRSNLGMGFGAFLENQLTSDGYSYLKSMLDESGETLDPAAKEWADFYGFTFHQNEFDSAHDWLDSRLSDCASQTTGDGSAELLSIAKDLAGMLDADQIQGLFQNDMDQDDYFKATGWYSSEID